MRVNSYIVASVESWNKELFDLNSKNIQGDWHYADTPEKLAQKLEDIQPKYIFFPHWRWIVPEEILNRYECVCFHMTDVPYGRGGSPLQNLILRGHKDTVITALRMEKGLDTGPVYLKTPLSLEGSAQEIYERASKLIWDMIPRLIQDNLTPIHQVGEPVIFKRRKPEESELPLELNLEKIFDYVRMLDADGYPSAFINHGDIKIKFKNAKLINGNLVADAEFIKRENL
jgi:methionyl-tRNA formyltransferase